MLAEQFHAAAEGARSLAELEDVSRLIGRAHAEGHLTDDAAQGLWEAAQARRARFKGMTPQPLPKPPSARCRPPRSPDRRASIERRRRQVASGAMPPALASQFTTGEAAALAVVSREVQRAGRCALYIDAIAAMAGVCRSVVQNAVREAARLGLLRVTERRIPGRKSLSNLLEVIDPSWRAWLRIGFRKMSAPVKDSKSLGQNARRSDAETVGRACGANFFNCRVEAAPHSEKPAAAEPKGIR